MFWTEAQQVAKDALLTGSLLPISTEPRIIVENGVRYYLHLKNANSKIKFSPKPENFNPFLPYEQDMFVANAGSNHVCLLNKFPVLAPHLLICSSEFVEQTSPLEQKDFDAWLLGYDDPEVFGFYNGGTTAGASQPHRHMQLVKTEIPLEGIITAGQLPFEHRLYRYDKPDGETLFHDYLDAMKAMKLYHPDQCKPYNILLAGNWMLILPRATNNIDGIFANGINYSGHFLVGNEDQIQRLREYGMMRFLTQCAQSQSHN